MSGKVDSSTSVQDPVSQKSSSRVMSIAVIGPNESHRKVVSKALTGTPGRSCREFIDYPARLSEIPRIVEQGFSVVMIDVDSDESYALKIIEGFAAAETVMVMAYSQRNDPALVTSCMRAGAKEFLPLPARKTSEEADSPEPEVAEEPSGKIEAPPKNPPVRFSQSVLTPPLIVPETKSGLPALVWESEAIEREGAATPQPPSPPNSEVVAEPSDSSSPAPELPSEPANSFEAWDAANLRMTQSASAKPVAPPMRTPSPHELFARSRKTESEPAAQPESPKPPRPQEPPLRPSAAPELLARNAKPKVQEISRPDPSEGTAVREKPAPPLPHEMFLKSASNGAQSSSSEDVPMDMFERTPRQVYRPTPQEMTFSSLAKDPNEGKQRGGGMIWAFLAAGAGMLGCLAFLFFFFARPTNSHPAQAPAAAPAAVQASTPAAPPTSTSQPDVFDKEFGSSATAGTTLKPSPRKTDTSDDSASATSSVSSQLMDQQLSAQSKLSGAIKQPAPEEPPSGFTPGSMDGGSSLPGSAFAAKSAKVVPAGAAISGGVAEGLLIRRTQAVYPAIAKSAHVEGTIVIGATITKSGALANLRVISGPAMLREAAMDAVRNWRYRPYMLNNQPIDVDTTISLVFSLNK